MADEIKIVVAQRPDDQTWFWGLFVGVYVKALGQSWLSKTSATLEADEIAALIPGCRVEVRE